MFNIFNGCANIDYNIFFEIKEIKITRGHNYTLVKNKVDWTLESILVHSGPSLYGMTYQLIMYMLVVFICSRTK